MFLSGAVESLGRSYAGVGFLVAPWAIKSVISFRGINDRLASLRVKQSGGVLTILSVYAPHNGHKLEARQHFFLTPSENTRIRNKHSSTFVCGDLNAQLGHVGMGEEQIIGPYVYRKQVYKLSSTTSNRELLLEYCIAHSLSIGNTFFDYPDSLLVFYFNLATLPMEPVTAGKFCQLDNFLCDQQDLDLLKDCWTCRTSTFQSHHFPTILVLETNFVKQNEVKHVQRVIPILSDTVMRDKLANSFNSVMSKTYGKHDLGMHAKQVAEAFVTASEVLPRQSITRKRPWVSEKTLQIITARNVARHTNDYVEEVRLNKLVRASAKDDKRDYLQTEFANGSWRCAGKLKTWTFEEAC